MKNTKFYKYTHLHFEPHHVLPGVQHCSGSFGSVLYDPSRKYFGTEYECYDGAIYRTNKINEVMLWVNKRSYY